jgi:hypothetical protein
MESLKKRVISLIRPHFPGCTIEWRKTSRGDRIGGDIVWSGFRGMDQLDRQEILWDALGKLKVDERRQVGMFFTFTPDELVAVEENAKEGD